MTGLNLYRYHCEYARQQTDRVSSILALVEAGLRLEMKFQDEKVDRPISEMDGPFIPSLGEILDTLAICQDTLKDIWERLARAEQE